MISAFEFFLCFFVLDPISFNLDFTSYEKFFKREFPMKKLDFVEAPNLPTEGMENPGIIMIHSSFFPVNFWDPLNVVNSATLFYNLICSIWIGHELQIQWWDCLWLKKALNEFLSYHSISYVSTKTQRKNIYYSEDDYKLVACKKKNWGYVDGTNNSELNVLRDFETDKDARDAFDDITYARSLGLLNYLNQRYTVTFIHSLRNIFELAGTEKKLDYQLFKHILKNSYYHSSGIMRERN